jgi:hypothetical protein
LTKFHYDDKIKKKMKIRILIFLIAIALFILSNICIPPLHANTISIQKGLTTKSEAIKIFGQPYMIKKIDGKECYFYKYGREWGQLNHSGDRSLIFIQFGPKDIAEDVYVTTESSIPRLKMHSPEEISKRDRETKETNESVQKVRRDISSGTSFKNGQMVQYDF